MSSLDVEPVESVDEESSAADRSEPDDDSRIDVGTADDLSPDAPEYVLYGGKGGVGKTTMAAATALTSAESGAATLVVSTDPAHSLSDTFETEIAPRPERIRDDVPLWAAEIDPDDAMAETASVFGMGDQSGGAGGADDPFGDGQAGGEAGGPADGPTGGPAGGAGGPLGGLGDLLGGDGPMDALMGGAMPGADEAAAMQLLVEYMDDPRFDRVVVDTAPTGHTLRLLELPEIMDTMVGRMVTIRERIGGMIDGVKGMFGGDAPGDEDGIDDLRELQDRIEKLRGTLRDPSKTDFRVVMVPEEMSVVESQRLVGQLDEFEIPVGTVIVNKVMENLADVTDDVDASQFVSPNLDSCEFCQRRWDVQQDALASAQDLFRGHEIKRVPLFADEVRGEEMLRIVARCLD
ncbi:arsenite efflux ATP-binding protein ArsA [Natronoarchaeum philippinense]|uniref:Arsenite efflux ATP-binding protein ArsA n=1 Tax=Natronoarchaeum philippinense TaxID=558529 RepID=A0A285NVJ6_NATPI|nr:ArsA family ATPase [Natronoarchaeum philippinense]SNZ13047.1 arsenite efflux ATP-binding protein ArsA [Natronoarchaeum philippinense]